MNAPGDESRGNVAFPALPPWLAQTAALVLAMRNRWPHALLVCGPEGVGKEALALHLARALLCEAPLATGNACGTCASCRYAAAGQHPDLRRVEPVEIDDEGVSTPSDVIKIDAIRALTDWAQLTSHRGVAKVAVVTPAERMNPSAANALLKTLEEPPAGTNLILVSHRPGQLFPTILSRCQRLAIPLPPTDVARPWLEAQGVQHAELALAQAGGAPFLARASNDTGSQEERAAWLTALGRPRELSPVALAARIDLGGKDGRRDRLAAALDWLIAWTADLCRVVSGGQAARNPDHAQALTELRPRVAELPLFRYHRQLLEQRALMARSLQPRLVAEALLIDYRTLFS